MTGEGTAFLYPFIDGEERDQGSLLADLASSARGKAVESHRLACATLDDNASAVAAAARDLVDRFEARGRLFCFGNGGSATDALTMVTRFAAPPWGRPLPAHSLVNDQAVLTAIGNDVGFEIVFQRQLIALAGPGDAAVGFSTSGNSANLMAAFAWATSHGLLTLGFTGYDGGQMAASGSLDHCFVVRSQSVHRIQESQAALAYSLWSTVQDELAERGARVTDQRAPSEAAPADGREAAVLERIETFRRRRPRLRDDVITLAHGAGKASAALIDAVFLEAFSGPDAGPLVDAALLALPAAGRLAITTDSFVVTPRRFPGGSIGHLAVHGTVNDLAVSGAHPLGLAVAFILEEGLAVDDLRGIVADMAEAAARAKVSIVTGDTKVVNRGAVDGLYITTTGIGVVPEGRDLGAHRVQPGDRLLVSGSIADHGMAVMLARGDLALEADLASDTAPLGDLIEVLLAAAPGTRWLRDPTRGGLGTIANELARDANMAVVLDESAIPVEPAVMGACDLLGIDPLYVANEGKFVAVLPAGEAEAGLAAVRRDPLGSRAALIGEIRAEPEGIVVLQTTFGGTRIVDMLVGDPLPRIC